MFTCLNINDRAVGLLGNKLFIIAACKANNLRMGINEPFIPHWDYEKDFPNLKCFEKYPHNMYYTYSEPCFSYRELPIGNYHVKGYFQSEKYFKEYRKEIIEMFECNEDTKSMLEEFKQILPNRLTSIHVRRGDYIGLEDFHPLCTMEYYLSAMEKLDAETDKFVIFSNDIDWCDTEFSKTKYCDKIVLMGGHSNIHDLFAMAMCDNNIIANSSFSWWGAWLNKKENKKVIAPKTWFGPKGPQDTQDIYCDGWVII